jgi:hypothetical protein
MKNEGMNNHQADCSIRVGLSCSPTFEVYHGTDNNTLVCNRNDVDRFISVPMFTRILVAMVKPNDNAANDNAADNIGYDRSLDRTIACTVRR